MNAALLWVVRHWSEAQLVARQGMIRTIIPCLKNIQIGSFETMENCVAANLAARATVSARSVQAGSYRVSRELLH